MMWKVAKSDQGTVLSGNLKNVGKLVGKELLLQGAMCGLNKLEDKALGQIFKVIINKSSLQRLLNFDANNHYWHQIAVVNMVCLTNFLKEDSLGQIVNNIFEKADHTSQENIKIMQEFFGILCSRIFGAEQFHCL